MFSMSTIYYSRCYLAILVLFQVHWMVTPLRLKISIEKKFESNGFFSRTKRSTSACSNYQKIDPKNISYDHRPKPWDRSPAVTFVSDTVTQGMNKALMAHVPGLSQTTIKDVFAKLEQHGCICLPFGGSVRDQFLGGNVLDIDADTPCDVHKVVEICKKYWKSEYCKAPKSTSKLQIVHIGEYTEGDGEEIDLANWNNTFFGNLTNLEYTTNSLGYYDDAKNNRGVVIDLPGSGVNDTCNMVINIPVPRNQWEDWYHNDSFKIFRYWKLRAKGYKANGNELPSFIANKTKEILPTKSGKRVFRTTFFKYAFSGDYNDTRKLAIVPYPVCANLSQQIIRRNEYYVLYHQVLGEYWENVAKALLDEINIECPPQTTSSSPPSPRTTSEGNGSGRKTNWSILLFVVGVVIHFCCSYYI